MSRLPARRGLRAGWLIAALFQLVFPAFASVADARAEALGLTAVAHVEAHEQASCIPTHPADCAICRVLAASAVTSRGMPSIPVTPRLVASVVSRPVGANRSARPAGDPPQRAPPPLG